MYNELYAEIDRLRRVNKELLRVLADILDGGIADPEKVRAAHATITKAKEVRHAQG